METVNDQAVREHPVLRIDLEHLYERAQILHNETENCMDRFIQPGPVEPSNKEAEVTVVHDIVARTTTLVEGSIENLNRINKHIG